MSEAPRWCRTQHDGSSMQWSLDDHYIAMRVTDAIAAGNAESLDELLARSPTPSAAHVELMVYATGGNATARRNYICIAPSERALWQQLVAWGFAIKNDAEPATYHVTSRGLDHLYGVRRPRRARVTDERLR